MADETRLQRLARDIIDDFRCDCFVEDLPEDEDCPCGGDGRSEKDAPGLEGCWNCQAWAALADDAALREGRNVT